MSQIFGPLQASCCHFTNLVSCSSLFSSLPLDPTWLICSFLESFETAKTKATKSPLVYSPYNLLFTDWFSHNTWSLTFYLSFPSNPASSLLYHVAVLSFTSASCPIILSLSFCFIKSDTVFSPAPLIHGFFLVRPTYMLSLHQLLDAIAHSPDSSLILHCKPHVVLFPSGIQSHAWLVQFSVFWLLIPILLLPNPIVACTY